jgi:hypothetical protein
MTTITSPLVTTTQMITPLPPVSLMTLIVGPGAGVGASMNTKGTDYMGQITLYTGTYPTTNELICNITFPNTMLFNNFSINLTPANNFAAMSISNVYCYGISSSSFSLMNAGMSLLPSTTYVWYYSVTRQN